MPRALVLGSRGFLGALFVEELTTRGYDVATVDSAIPLPKGRKAENIFAFDHERRYDLVVHAAAYSPSRVAIDNTPLEVARNFALDSAYFQYLARVRPPKAIYLSSSAVYPVHMQTVVVGRRLAEYMATPVWHPDGIYGLVKVAGEAQAKLLNEADRGTRVTVIRPFSGTGATQGASYPAAAIAARAKCREDPLVVWSGGWRDWIHGNDIVGAALTLASEGFTAPVNVCSGVGTNFTDLAAQLAAEAGYDGIVSVRRQGTGVEYRVGDPTEMNRHYVLKYSLTDIVKELMA